MFVSLVPLLFASPTARAAAPHPIPVTIHAQDLAGSPVSSATIQIIDDAEVRVVDAKGRWTGDGVTLTDGSSRPFAKKSAIQFEVRADGFAPTRVMYLVRKKKNEVIVRLAPAAE